MMLCSLSGILGIVAKGQARTVICVYEAGLAVNSQVDRVVRCRAAAKDSDESSMFSCWSSSRSSDCWVWLWLIFWSSFDFMAETPPAKGVPYTGQPELG
jgi:hypothetical protein